MGVPDRPSPGKHGLAGSAGGQGQPRDGVPPILRYIPAFWNSLDPASQPKQGGGGEGGGRREGIWDSLPPPRNIYFTQKKSGPTQPNPQQRLPLGRRSVADCLSRSNPSRKLKPSKKKEKKTWSLPSLSEEQIFQQSVGFQAQSSQDYLSYPPDAPNSPKMREKALSNKYEKLVVSRLEDSSYFCTKLSEIWLSGGFLTHNSCAMMHKRQLWSKFKI